MKEKLRKINLRTALIMAICFYSLTMALHILVISSVIPFCWVNGGRSDSFESQLPISVVGMVVCIIGGAFTIFAGQKKRYLHKRGKSIICWCFVALWTFGFFQQLLGTSFEKLVCSFLLLLGVVSHLRMAIETRR